jgi:hypothetical protein
VVVAHLGLDQRAEESRLPGPAHPRSLRTASRLEGRATACYRERPYALIKSG